MDATRLRELLIYYPDTGLFRWRETSPNGGKRIAGAIAGHISKKNGYVLIGLDGKLYYGHRLAWLYVNGEWPPGLLDHRDLDKANNRIGNLRPGDDSHNMANGVKRPQNSSGYKGVTAYRDRWKAQIMVRGKQHYLGIFDMPESAALAYREAAVKFFGEFART